MQREALMQECADKFKKSFLDCYRRKVEESQRKLQGKGYISLNNSRREKCQLIMLLGARQNCSLSKEKL